MLLIQRTMKLKPNIMRQVSQRWTKSNYLTRKLFDVLLEN